MSFVVSGFFGGDRGRWGPCCATEVNGTAIGGWLIGEGSQCVVSSILLCSFFPNPCPCSHGIDAESDAVGGRPLVRRAWWGTKDRGGSRGRCAGCSGNRRRAVEQPVLVRKDARGSRASRGDGVGAFHGERAVVVAIGRLLRVMGDAAETD